MTDILTWPSLQDSTISLMDLNESKLETMAALARRMIVQKGTGAKVEASTDLRAAIDGADYVTVSISVGRSRDHVEIPLRYGVDQAIGDTSGPGGVFYYLRNAPAMINIAKTMEETCPGALMLNYTNPMTMLCWTMEAMSSIRYVGLCHSVQGTATDLAEYIGAPVEDLSYWVAGINHMAWFLKLGWKGQDAYPLLREAMRSSEIYERDIVKWEIMKHFGAFVSESSIHNSEYMPYFRRTPDLIDAHTDAKMWGVSPKGTSREERRAMFMQRRQSQEQENERLAFGDEDIPIERSHEYFSHILNAIEVDSPYVFHGNVPNTGLITNLRPGAIVEVPILADGCGLHPLFVGDLPPALAALNQPHLSLYELAVKGFVEQNREFIYRAVQLDPLTTTKVSLPDIRRMVDEIFEAYRAHIAF